MSSSPRAGHHAHTSPFNIIVVVAALGYFVDIYDLLLFGIVRRDSLIGLGLHDDAAIKTVGVMLLDWQMAGLLLGGIIWGLIGDMRGRLAVLFGSIIMYSLANIANGLVEDITMYAVLRFLAGIGLAGELGAGVTLVSETMHKDHRGWGTTLVASFGVLGAVVASLVGDLLHWREAYFVGGGLGLALLVLRFSTYESGMFAHAKASGRRPRLRSILGTRESLTRYLACIGIGLPIWFAIGLLVLLSKEVSTALGLTPAASPGTAIMWAYVGLAVGDFTSGYYSQKIRSRKRAVATFLGLLIAAIVLYLAIGGTSHLAFYGACVVVGIGAGYWALFVTIASEQFGTDVRATVTTTVPNFVRGAVIPITLAFLGLEKLVGTVGSVAIVGLVCFGLAFLSWWRLDETFGKDLDYTEHDRAAIPHTGL